MCIAMYIVDEDLTTMAQKVGRIVIDDDFYNLRRVAEEEHCILIATIDDAGDTVINRLQYKPFKNEIQKLRSRTDINQHLLDQLQAVADASDPLRWYIIFMGA